MLEQRMLGNAGPIVSELGLGCMGMSGSYGPADEQEGIATIHAELDAGMNLIDTGDFYGTGHNELLIREALRGRDRSRVLLSVKFGALRDPQAGWNGSDGRPKAVKNFLAYSLKRLGTDYIDIYRPSRVDPEVPVEETVGAAAEIVQAGYVRYVGMSEVNGETLRRAATVHPICDLQIEYSLITRDIEAEILPACRELGIGITAYGVLSRGLISGHWRQERSLAGDLRAHLPRFSGENQGHNLALVDAIRALAVKKGCTVAQVAIAWVTSRGADIIPVPGTRRREQLTESLGAAKVKLTAEDVTELEASFPDGAASGGRYSPRMMPGLNSRPLAN